ncbi:flagellar hook-associated protein 1 FlgK [Hasllibacter halocynthiae]|uniref:Flagellar hook-associated protein 1 n=1 Tax=Hasllibacter halocynthiae TaxID=595589 RepID=A0A2T0X2L4_9RHOB|nr:flagellar basal body rod C-terminal domain-containing protein [Hasllibacter halocynthiae]PRY93192.1 flagellar hook-associated protein 1 FlgK [Hasllibacter halocynthiae]
MSITRAFANAGTGMAAAARAAQVVSDNVANAATPGYGRRTLGLAAAQAGGAPAGVRVTGVARAADAQVATDLRLARGSAAAEERLLAAAEDVLAAVGAPEDPSGLEAALARVPSALHDAAADPGDASLLALAVDAIDAAAGALGRAAKTVATGRERAEAAIADGTRRLNSALEEVADLNRRVALAGARGQDTAALEDRRRQVIDAAAGIVPLRAVPREGGQVALATASGHLVLDGAPRPLTFAPAARIAPAMVAGGALGHVLQDGRALTGGGAGGLLAGGALGAAFALRDEVLPDIQADLDAVAADLARRLGPGGPDPAAPGDAGPLSDAGGPVGAAPDPGLAGRLRLDPALSAEPWRLRDGLRAAAPGPADGALLSARGAALSSPAPGAADLAGLARAPGARAAHAAGLAEGRRAAAGALEAELAARDRANGVDIDSEMRDLILIEQAYDANARVLQAIDAMLARLSEI